MSIFSKSESGTKVYRSRFPIRLRTTLDADWFSLYPVVAQFVLPGDVYRPMTDMLIRLQPMLSPSLTSSAARVRCGFVPIRLVEDEAEFVITGSQDGVYKAGVTPPDLPNLWAKATDYTVVKGSVCDIMFGMPVGNYQSIKDNESMPALYWLKGYCRFWWDYYRDENLFTEYTDFDDWFASIVTAPGKLMPLPVGLPKDYFTSSLPWQLKGVAPVISVNNTGHVEYSVGNSGNVSTANAEFSTNASAGYRFAASTQNIAALQGALNNNKIVLNDIGFDAAELRAMLAQTRVFERLARTGSRYTEYLRANFNTSPADETLQRSQYLGGYKQPIVTTEVVQTAGAESSSGGNLPVGTLRGHGISHASEGLGTFHFKEFGMFFVFVDFRPRVQYTQGINKQFTYKRRFDFFNPSFQHLSEQEVRNGEIFIDFGDGKNDDTWGFQAYANELRTGREMVVGDMRDTLSYWTQALHLAKRPNLNWSFLNGQNHKASWMQPFAVTDGNPIICDFGCVIDAYRPMVRYGTPGLVDHL